MLVPENSEEIDLDPFPFSSSPRPSSIVLHRMQQQSSRKSNLAQTEGHLKERSQVLSFSSNTADISFCGDGDGKGYQPRRGFNDTTVAATVIRD